MARGRMIDQHYTKSRKLNSLPRDYRYIYAAILPYLDREGRIIAEPRHLDGTVFLKTDVRKDEIADALQAFARVGLIELYADEDGMAILQYTRFSEFNTPNHREKASELPAPTGEPVEVASETGVNIPPGDARASDGLNVNENVNVNDNENKSMSPIGDERADLARVERSELETLLDAWNENRGPLPAAQKLTSNRRSKLKTLIRDLGGFDKAYSAIAIGAAEVARDDFWQRRGYGFDNLLAGQKVIQKAETAWNRGSFDREQAEVDRMLAALGPN